MHKLALLFFTCAMVLQGAITLSFDKDSTLALKIIRPNTGSTFVPGMIGKQALQINGTGKDREKSGGALIANLPFDFTKPFTAQVILRMNPDAGYRDFKEIFSLCDGERGPGLRLVVFYNMVILRTGNGKKTVDLATNSAVAGLAPGKWQMITVTCDGKNAVIYLNGIEAVRGAFKINPCRNRTLSIGSFRYGYAYPLQGAIDQLSLYDHAFTAQETAEAYLQIFGD